MIEVLKIIADKDAVKEFLRELIELVKEILKRKWEDLEQLKTEIRIKLDKLHEAMALKIDNQFLEDICEIIIEHIKNKIFVNDTASSGASSDAAKDDESACGASSDVVKDDESASGASSDAAKDVESASADLPSDAPSDESKSSGDSPSSDESSEMTSSAI